MRFHHIEIFQAKNGNLLTKLVERTHYRQGNFTSTGWRDADALATSDVNSRSFTPVSPRWTNDFLLDDNSCQWLTVQFTWKQRSEANKYHEPKSTNYTTGNCSGIGLWITCCWCRTRCCSGNGNVKLDYWPRPGNTCVWFRQNEPLWRQSVTTIG